MGYGNNLVEADRLVGVYVGGDGGRRQRTDQLVLAPHTGTLPSKRPG
jgi:hypothetical protein